MTDHVATMRGRHLADGTTADLELFLADEVHDHRRAFAAMVFLLAAGDVALVHSVRRDHFHWPLAARVIAAG